MSADRPAQAAPERYALARHGLPLPRSSASVPRAPWLPAAVRGRAVAASVPVPDPRLDEGFASFEDDPQTGNGFESSARGADGQDARDVVARAPDDVRDAQSSRPATAGRVTEDAPQPRQAAPRIPSQPDSPETFPQMQQRMREESLAPVGSAHPVPNDSAEPARTAALVPGAVPQPSPEGMPHSRDRAGVITTDASPANVSGADASAAVSTNRLPTAKPAASGTVDDPKVDAPSAIGTQASAPRPFAFDTARSFIAAMTMPSQGDATLTPAVPTKTRAHDMGPAFGHPDAPEGTTTADRGERFDAVRAIDAATLAALQAPAAPPARSVRIDRVQVTVQSPAPPAARAATPLPAAAAAPARAATPSRSRNPWSSYFIRRD